jgi:hypothetical protein
MDKRELDSAEAAVLHLRDDGLNDVLTAINLIRPLIRPGKKSQSQKETEAKYQDQLCAMLERNAASLLEIAARLACDE